MSTRIFTAEEIVEMRSHVYAINEPLPGNEGNSEWRARAEDQLRTYILAGTDPAQLKAIADRHKRRLAACFPKGDE